MSLDLIKKKLAELNKQSQKPTTSNSNTNLFWKPGQLKNDQGEIQPDLIRILPNKHAEPGYPFQELYFYYDFGKTWISPTCFAKEDPIIEYCNGLTSGQKLTKEEFVTKSKIKKKLLPKERIYVPILSRDNEAEGVKFWGFSKTIFTQLLEIMADDDYGDITDLDSGRDITVKYTPPTKDGEYGKTSIIVKPKQTKATSDAETILKIESMVNIAEQFTCPTSEELQEALHKYLNVEPEVKSSNPINRDVRVNHAATNEGFDVEVKPKEKKSVDDLASDLDALFEGDFFKD